MSSGPFKYLLAPITLGDMKLPNRIMMAAMTRQRCDPTTNIPNDMMVQYYTKRADCGLILTECTSISTKTNAFPGAAGIYNDEQAEGWRKVVDSVHDAGGRIFLQIWHAGRASHSKLQNGETTIAPSAIPIRGINMAAQLPQETPKEMSLQDIEKVKDEFKKGALRAKQAGFDGVQLHGAHGYLVDQFLRASANQRTDKYGGTIERRSRFCLEVMDLLCEVFGHNRVGIKVSPVGCFNDMYDPHALQLYTYLFKELNKRQISFIELKQDQDQYKAMGFDYPASKSIIFDVYHSLRPYYDGVICGNNNLTPETANNYIKKEFIDMVSFARLFISNPDLVRRLKEDLPVEYNWDPDTFYKGGEHGYLDYPDFDEELHHKSYYPTEEQLEKKTQRDVIV